VFLIDMQGNVVHTWPNCQNPKLMENGNILGGFSEYDWDGNRVWSWSVPASRSNLRTHHDSWRIYNKKLGADTTISLTRYTPTQDEAVAAGCDPSVTYTGAYADGIVEVDMNGTIVWEWVFLHHGIQDKNPDWPNYVGAGKTIADYPGRVDLHWMTDAESYKGTLGRAGLVSDWQHSNALDYNPDLDVIAINCKHWSEFYVVDHGATFVPGDPAASMALAAGPAGDIIYRFGNPSAYKQGIAPGFVNQGEQQMYGSHNIQWIKKTEYTNGPAIPGGGNFLIFNNGCYNPQEAQSEILEINPFLDASGNNTGYFVNPPLAGYDQNKNSEQIVWSFSSTEVNSFYSQFASGCQRLANGNTLVCSARHGHFFEFTPSREIVWEYVNPLGASGAKNILTDSMSNDYSVFRVYRYAPSYPAFAGRVLTPLGMITDLYPATALPAAQEALQELFVD
jgi:hypothetical protein